MSLLRRSGTAAVTVTPQIVRPRQTVTATVSTDRAIDEVATATLEWGYDNVYRTEDDRDSEDWVCVTRVELPVETSEFTGASANFRVPSWAPGSSPLIARWSCRVRIARGGPYVDERGEFTVVIGTDDVDAVVEPLEHSPGATEAEIDVVLGAPVYRAGETVTGQLVLRPTRDLPSGAVAVHWQCERESHPLAGRPAAAGPLDGPSVVLGGDVALREGMEVTLPFALPLPDDAAPTAAAVHSSLSWYVAARLNLLDAERDWAPLVRRPITVVNAP